MEIKEIAVLIIVYVIMPLCIVIPIIMNRKHKSRKPEFQFGGLTMLKETKMPRFIVLPIM